MLSKKFQHSTPNQSFNNSFSNNSFNKSLTPNPNKKRKLSPKNSDEKRGIERFRRIKEEEVHVDERVKDNSFEAKVSVLQKLRKRKKIKKKMMQNKKKSTSSSSLCCC